MTEKTRRNLLTVLTFAAVTATSAVVMWYIIAFLLTEQMSSMLAWVLIGAPLVAIFAKQRWLWTVFIVAVLLYAFINSGSLASCQQYIWGIATLICGIGGTVFLRRRPRQR